MTDERDKQYASELTRMSEDEVRQQMELSVQPVPFLRAMATTELERRRQKRTTALMGPGRNLGRVTVGAALFAAIAAAIAAWLIWAGYIG